MDKNLVEIIKMVLAVTIPQIQKLIESKLVPMLKRKAYEKVDEKVDKLITDLAQNASKIANEGNEFKKSAYIQGTQLGIETLRAIANKLNKAADEIEKVI